MSPHFKTLRNGLRVVMVPCEAESVAFGLFIASGSRHEPENVAGISHLIEHMLFKGTPTRKPLDIIRAIEGRGGNFNAFTSEESTAYFAHLPSEYLNEAMDILSDMYLNASIPEDEFMRERSVVLEEIKMYDDDPESVAMENLQRAMFPSNRVGAPVAGSAKTLLPLTAGDLRRYIKSHYLPENTIAVIVGSFNPKTAFKLAETKLGVFKTKNGEKVAFCPVSPKESPISEIATTKDVNQTQLALGYRTFGVADKRKYVATVLDALLGRGMSSRLFQEVREKRGLSYDISSRMQFFQDAGMWVCSAGLDPSKAKLALKTIDAELQKLCTTLVPEAELNSVKEFLIGNFRLSHEKVTSKLFYFGQTMLSFGRFIDPKEQVEGIRKVSAKDIRSVARAIFKPENRSLSWVYPKK